jgi:putative oxidoreductase
MTTYVQTNQTATMHLALDQQAAVFIHRFSAPIVRASLDIVFIWFGLLKMAGVSPAASLVAGTAPWANPAWFVPLVGVVVVVLGIGLFGMIRGRALGLIAGVVAGHMAAATCLVLITQPGGVFQHGNPMLLTMEGEFLAKNFVLIAAALMVVSHSVSDTSKTGRTTDRNAVSL